MFMPKLYRIEIVSMLVGILETPIKHDRNRMTQLEIDRLVEDLLKKEVTL